MSLEKSLGRLNRAYLVVGILLVGLLAARAFQRSTKPGEVPQPALEERQQVAGPAQAKQMEQIKQLDSDMETVTEERDELRRTVDEKEAQNAKLRESMEAIIKEMK
jgi:predicted RNase H-like nuclease (RuvC/YqgF family)